MSKTPIRQYLYNLLYSIDQLGNSLWGGCPDETISSRIGRLARAGRLRPLPRALMVILGKIDRDHCRDAIEVPQPHPPGSRAVVDVIDRCDAAIVREGVVYRCRKSISHPGEHSARTGMRGRRRWITWDK